MSKRILITGGTGYIGSNLIDELLKKDFEVYALLNISNTNKLNDKLHFVKYDGTFESLLVIEVEIDIIVHLATVFVSNHSTQVVDSMFKTNILLGVHLLEFAKERGIKRFINTSTYAQSIDSSYYNPQNLYAATKQAFDDILKFYSETGTINSITLALYDTYGPRDNRPKFINLVIEAFKKDEIFNMSPGNQIIRYVYIDDVVNAFCMSIELLLSNSINKSITYNVYGDESFSLNEMITHLCEIFKIKLKTNPGFYKYRDREIMDCEPKYERIPNWIPNFNLEAGINQILLQNENN
ncbi:NAD-dependent epimerase/dehydratase family protein [Flavobacterium aquidurense]|uniref:NAD-dependent epimerase/dehydratase family protein n=1 Tax=Flavobacterium aquidurense TaxID=362413 RepID=UPI003719FA4F